MEMREDDVEGPGSYEAAAGLSSPVEGGSAAGVSRSSAAVDAGRLKTRVPFDVEELNLLLGTVPPHLLRWNELERKFGKEAFQSWYDEAAKNKEKYLATYPDIYGSSDPPRPSPQCSSPKEPVDHESLDFDAMCDSIPGIIRAYSEAHLEKDEIGCDVTKEAVEQSKAEYKRLNELMKTFGKPAPRTENVNFWADSKKVPNRPKQLEDWVQSEAEWDEFLREVQREVDIVKVMCRNERYTPVVRKPLTWIDQFIGAVEKETGVPFDAEFANHMADLAAGKDSDVSVRAHPRSLNVEVPAGSDDSEDEWPSSSRKVSAQQVQKDDEKKLPKDPANQKANLEESPSADEAFNLEKELRSYVEKKKRILLSRLHDSGRIKWKKKAEGDPKVQQEVPKFELDDWYFGPKEFIVLRDEDGKKTRIDIVVDRDEDLSEKIAVIEGKPAKKKFRWTSTEAADKNYILKLLLPPRYLKELGIETDESEQTEACRELSVDTESNGSPALEVPCEVLKSSEEDREIRLQRRKMYRWERFRFRDASEIAEVELTSCGTTVESQRQPEVPEAPRHTDTPLTLADRRRRVADSLFHDDAKKYVEYVDPSEMTGWELRRPVPILTAGNLSRGLIPEVVSPQLEKGLPSKSSEMPCSQSTLPGSAVHSVTAGSEKTAKPGPVEPAAVLAPTVTESPVPTNEKVDPKKVVKDKKKKKKRRSSSSSDDLEMLEKKSEARLGLRK